MVDEPARKAVEQILRTRPTSISAVNLAEVVDTVIRARGQDPDDVHDRVDFLIVRGLDVEPVWLRVMWLATSLRAEHYHRQTAPVSLADCICIATAISLETNLATTDPALATVARVAGVRVIA